MPPRPPPEPATAPRAWFLVGPTAAGKTDVAHRLAARQGLALVSADAMLVYRGMDIGTAKPSADERRRFPYDGIDLADPGTAFSVGAYRAALRTAAHAWPSNGAPRIVVGGTGLYVRALLQGLPDSGPVPTGQRARSDQLQREGGLAALQCELERVDPGRLAGLADPRNPRRVARALERAWRGEPEPRTWDGPPPTLIGLRPDRALLHHRIAVRADRMFEGGLLAEAEALRKRYGTLSPTAAAAIGYREAWAVLDGRLDRASAVEQTAARTRALARRQMTWFRHQAHVVWVDIGPNDAVDAVAERVLTLWEHHGTHPLALGS